MWIIIPVIFVGLLSIFFLYIKLRFSIWERLNVPYKKPHLIYGNYADFLTKKTSFPQFISNVYNSFKGERFGGIWELHRPKVFILDPKLIRDILIKDFAIWQDRGLTVNLDVDPLEGHLAHLDGKKWRSVRMKLTPTFTSSKLKQMHNLLLECSENFEKYLDEVAKCNEPTEVKEMSAKFSVDVIGSCVFGIEMNSFIDDDALFRKMGEKYFQSSPKKKIIAMIQNSSPWLFKTLKLSTMSSDITNFFINITKDSFEYRETKNIQRHDFIDLLRNLKNSGQPLGDDEVEFDDKLLAAQAFVFFIAGFETSATTTSFAFHELAANENIQNRLREEIHRTKVSNDGEISWDSLKDMKYLDMIVQETLRKYPVAPQFERICSEPYPIRDTDVVLPKGSMCIIPIYGLHHDPEYYPDPAKFDPERFTEESKSQRPPFTFLPFGEGPRICIGIRFAEQQIKMALVTAIDKFKFSLCEKSQNPLRLDTKSRLLFPENGIWLKISKITTT